MRTFQHAAGSASVATTKVTVSDFPANEAGKGFVTDVCNKGYLSVELQFSEDINTQTREQIVGKLAADLDTNYKLLTPKGGRELQKVETIAAGQAGAIQIEHYGPSYRIYAEPHPGKQLSQAETDIAQIAQNVLRGTEVKR